MPFDRKLLFTYVILKTLTLFRHLIILPSTISPLQVISLCGFVVFSVMQSCMIMREFGTLRYLMKYFTYWFLYVWRHVQYYTIHTVTIVTQIPYISRFNYGKIVRDSQRCPSFCIEDNSWRNPPPNVTAHFDSGKANRFYIGLFLYAVFCSNFMLYLLYAVLSGVIYYLY